MLAHFWSVIQIDLAGVDSVISNDATEIEGLLHLDWKALCNQSLDVTVYVLALLAQFRHQLLDGEPQKRYSSSWRPSKDAACLLILTND